MSLNLFYDMVTHLVDQGKTVDLFYLFILANLSILSLLNKMSNIQLDGYIIWLVNKWLLGWSQKVVVNEVTSGWQPVSHKWGFSRTQF